MSFDRPVAETLAASLIDVEGIKFRGKDGHFVFIVTQMDVSKEYHTSCIFYFAAALHVLFKGTDLCSDKDSPCLTLNRLLELSLHQTKDVRNIHIEVDTSLNITQETMVGTSIFLHFET